MLAVILTLLCTLLSLAFVLSVQAAPGWDTGSLVVAVVTCLTTLLVALNAIRDYALSQFLLATAVALAVAAGAGGALHFGMDSRPDDVNVEARLRGGDSMGPGDEAKATVPVRPTSGELRLRFTVTNESSGTPCLSISTLAVSDGSDVYLAELEKTTEVTVSVDESDPEVSLTLRLQGAEGQPLAAGCRVSLEPERAVYV